MCVLTDDRNQNYREKVDTLNNYKDIELGKVSFTNAVINPRAVMIVSVYALEAKGAMATSRCPDYLAIWT